MKLYFPSLSNFSFFFFLLFLVIIADDSFVRPVTFWIVGDFDKPSGRQLLYDAIKHQVGNVFTGVGWQC